MKNFTKILINTLVMMFIMSTSTGTQPFVVGGRVPEAFNYCGPLLTDKIFHL